MAIDTENKITLTEEGKEDLEKELRELLDVTRPAVLKQLQEAREQGDLSENAEYDAAKARQAEIEARIADIKNTLANAEIIKEDKRADNSKVRIGSKVTIIDLSDNEKYTYDIVGDTEADPDHHKISSKSPLAHVLMDKTVGRTCEVHGISNPYKVKITKIEN